MGSTSGRVNVELFGLDGKAQLVTLERGPMKLQVTNWGATIISLFVPDVAGNLADVVLGFDKLTPYMDGTSPYFGSIVGRVANRIDGASFTLDGKTYKLSRTNNNVDITLHGGQMGYDKVLWKLNHVQNGENPSVEFFYHSVDGEQGFPGDVDVFVTYTLSDNLELTTVMRAIPLTKSTPINLAQHSYWNLAGHQSGDILGHQIQIWASHITPVNEALVPTGEILSVEGTPFDFRHGRVIKYALEQVQGGYDHNYVLETPQEGEGNLRLAARVKDPFSGRVMDLLTTALGMQFYTGNFIPFLEAKEGVQYRKHSGLCLETQGFPNAVNQPNFPSITVAPGQEYKHIMVHRFNNEK